MTPGPEFGRAPARRDGRRRLARAGDGPATAGPQVVISGDTAPCEAVQIAAHAADLLIHEATFADDERERAAETMHSTAGQAAELAREAGGDAARAHALLDPLPASGPERRGAAIFPSTVLPRDFDTIEIPFAERGEPELVRWEEPAPPTRTGGSGAGRRARDARCSTRQGPL